MIVRILNEGQWKVEESAVRDLNTLDDQLEQAVAGDDQEGLSEVLQKLLDRVRNTGTRLPDEELHDSDLILPALDSTLAEVQAMLNDSEEGLIPN